MSSNPQGSTDGDPVQSLGAITDEGLPLVAYPAQDADSSLRGASPTRILLVDDEDWICDVLSRVLRRHQYVVNSAGSAEQALDLLREASFDLVISDMMLPGLSGLELSERVSRMHPNLPVVLITGRADADLMRDALRRGVCDFLPKPFDIETIPLVVERNLERRALDMQRQLAIDDTVMVNTVQALAAAIDAKEPFTAQHSRRVAQLALALARALELPSAEQRQLELAALVHDVGKIGVPDEILLKAGPLTEEEWAAMRLHPVQGAVIVGQVEQLTYVADVVRHHHERMDGAGYPDGLRGEAIPYLSRIIAVADAYEVMTSDRVYRARLSDETAMRRLHEAGGAQFDAQVVEAFSRLWPGNLHEDANDAGACG